MLDPSLIGRESEPVVVEVEKGAIRRFAEALGDPCPLYVDEDAARAAGYAGVLAPPTFAATLATNARFRSALDLGAHASLHGEQQLEYGRPIVAGDRLIVKTKVVDVQERVGASGVMGVLVLEDEGRGAQGEFVFRARSVFVLRRG